MSGVRSTPAPLRPSLTIPPGPTTTRLPAAPFECPTIKPPSSLLNAQLASFPLFFQPNITIVTAQRPVDNPVLSHIAKAFPLQRIPFSLLFSQLAFQDQTWYSLVDLRVITQRSPNNTILSSEELCLSRRHLQSQKQNREPDSFPFPKGYLTRISHFQRTMASMVARQENTSYNPSLDMDDVHTPARYIALFFPSFFTRKLLFLSFCHVIIFKSCLFIAFAPTTTGDPASVPRSNMQPRTPPLAFSWTGFLLLPDTCFSRTTQWISRILEPGPTSLNMISEARVLLDNGRPFLRL